MTSSSVDTRRKETERQAGVDCRSLMRHVNQAASSTVKRRLLLPASTTTTRARARAVAVVRPCIDAVVSVVQDVRRRTSCILNRCDPPCYGAALSVKLHSANGVVDVAYSAPCTDVRHLSRL